MKRAGGAAKRKRFCFKEQAALIERVQLVKKEKQCTVQQALLSISDNDEVVLETLR